MKNRFRYKLRRAVRKAAILTASSQIERKGIIIGIDAHGKPIRTRDPQKIRQSARFHYSKGAVLEKVSAIFPGKIGMHMRTTGMVNKNMAIAARYSARQMEKRQRQKQKRK